MSQHLKQKSVFKTLWDDSQTKIWSYIQTGTGAIILTLGELHSYITDPTIKSYLDSLNLPREVSIGIVLFGLVTYICHGHGQDHA